jgi:hypothetical protein
MAEPRPTMKTVKYAKQMRLSYFWRRLITMPYNAMADIGKLLKQFHISAMYLLYA